MFPHFINTAINNLFLFYCISARYGEVAIAKGYFLFLIAYLLGPNLILIIPKKGMN
jgi:hypothetical protein